MKTCNGGMCEFKAFGGPLPECKYNGYCDHQCPRYSHNTWVVPETMIEQKRTAPECEG